MAGIAPWFRARSAADARTANARTANAPRRAGADSAQLSNRIVR